jgi:putative hydrolase of the HAD superfamily
VGGQQTGGADGNAPSGLLFDYFETLVTRPQGGLGHGERLGCPEVFDQVWRQWGSRRQTARISYEELLGEVCEKADVDPAIVPVLAADRADRQAQLLLDPHPDVLAMLTAAKSTGAKVGLVSNCAMEDVAGWSRSPFAELVAVPVFSCDVGSMKPNPRIYEVALDHLGMAAEETAFVSDSISDLRAARAVGVPTTVWATWFLDRQGHGAVSHDLAGELPDSDHLRISDAKDLVAALGF